MPGQKPSFYQMSNIARYIYDKVVNIPDEMQGVKKNKDETLMQ